LLAEVQVAVPSHLSNDAEEKLAAFAEALPKENPRDELLAKARD
ncbi:MAG: J domain-containing protein, partial [Cryobacterium sp.]|nr:J domain-containing protein [Cryobacterium sp.]